MAKTKFSLAFAVCQKQCITSIMSSESGSNIQWPIIMLLHKVSLCSAAQRVGTGS